LLAPPFAGYTKAMRRTAAMACLAALLGTPPAVAQTSGTSDPLRAPEDSATSAEPDGAVGEARAAFQQATSLARQGRWVDALHAFERSAALHPHAITTYDMGYCERVLGHWTRARKMLLRALEEHEARGGTELPLDLVAATQAFLGEADRQIARVRVSIATEGGALGVDGRPLELAGAGAQGPVLVGGSRAMGPAEVPPAPRFEVELDPGEHAFVLVSRGRPDVIVTETLAPGSQSVLELRAQPDEGRGAATEAQRPRKVNRKPAFIALGIGAAGIATGVVAGLVALGKKGDVAAACTAKGDYPSCDAQRSAANLAADVSTTGFAVGGVGVAVGAVLFIFAPEVRSETRLPRPWIGWRSVGVEGAF
jgi:hypothetical protein